METEWNEVLANNGEECKQFTEMVPSQMNMNPEQVYLSTDKEVEYANVFNKGLLIKDYVNIHIINPDLRWRVEAWK